MPLRPRTAALLCRALAAFLVLAAATTALAQRTIHVPGDAPTIQAGIDAAVNGDTVMVAPGTYLENIDFTGKAITVASSDGAATTIIDGQSRPRAVVTFRSGETPTSVLRGFTLQGGGQSYEIDSSDPDVRTRATPVGGVFVEKSSPTILNNVITRNACGGIFAINQSGPTIVGNNVNNTLPVPAVNPGNLYCIFASGSAIAIRLSNAVSIIDHNIIENNAGSDLATVLISYSDAVMTRNILRGNSLTYASTFYGSGSVVFTVGTNGFTFASNLLYGNSLNGSTVQLTEIDQDPGFFHSIITNNTIVHNTSVKGANPGPFAQLSLDGQLSRTLVANNIIDGSAQQPAVACDLLRGPSTTPASFDHNDIWDDDGSTAVLGSCAFRAGTHGNLSQDALFRNPSSNDFRLATGSPAVDAGITSALADAAQVVPSYGTLIPDALGEDLDGNVRASDATGQGFGVVDMGAYEAAGSASPIQTESVLQVVPYSVPAGVGTAYGVVLHAPQGTPSGDVEFFVDDAPKGYSTLGPILGSSDSSASALQPALPGGVHSVIARYGGNGAYSPSVSALTYFFVAGPAAPTPAIQLTSSSNPSPLAAPVTLSASVSGAFGSPTGSVLFSSSSATLGTQPLVRGTATLTTPVLPRGAYPITATYSGDTAYQSASASLQQSVVGTPSTTALSASALTVPAGTPIAFTATTLEQGNAVPDLSRLAILEGSAALTPTTTTSASSVTASATLAPGTHVLTASFSGDTIAEPSTSAPLTVTVAPYPTTLALTAPGAVAFHDAPLLATAHFDPAPAAPPGGTITFSTGATSLGIAPFSGSQNAGALTVNLPAGTYPIHAVYTPAIVGQAGASADGTLVVARARVTLALTSAVPPAPIPPSKTSIFTATFDDGTGRHLATGGIIPLLDGQAQPAIPLSADGSITFPVTGLAPGDHTVVLTYPGDVNFLPATTASAILTVLNRDFLFSGDQALTIQAEHYRSLAVRLTSVGDFAGSVALSCADLPPNASCRFSRAPVGLTAGNSADVTLTIDTSALPGYMASRDGAQGQPDGAQGQPAIVIAVLAPFGFVTLLLARRRTRLNLLLVLLATLAAGLTGCSGLYPASTPIGTYTIHVIGQSADTGGTSAALLHSQPITLVVTP